MTFSKTGRMVNDNFRFIVGIDELERVNQYKYLGVIFTEHKRTEHKLYFTQYLYRHVRILYKYIVHNMVDTIHDT